MMNAVVILSAVDKMSRVVNKAYGNAQRKLDQVGRSSARIAKQSAAFARGAAAPAAAIGVALAVPIKKAVEFEQAIADVGAVSRATESQIAAMATQARKMGAQTQFSAVQSAQAMQFLAMAGFNSQQAIDALPGTLNLAAAGNVELARSADIASNVLSGFNLQVSELGMVGDVLTNTFTTSNTTLEMLGESMKFAAPIAAGLGVDIQTVAAMAGKLGDAGIQGTMAGTALRASMLRLSAPMKKGRMSLEEIGVATVDAAGNLRPLPDLLAEIGAKVNKLPTGKQAEIIKNIFGTEAASAATVLLNQARTGSLQEYIATLSRSGSAAEVAGRRMNTSQGALLRLKSAGEELAIVTGNVLLPIVAEMAEKSAVIAQKVGAWAEANPKLTKGIVKTVAVVGTLLAAMAAVGAVISGVASAISFIVPIISFIGSAIAGVVAAVGAVPILIGAAITGIAVLLYENWEKVKAFFTSAWEWIKEAGATIGTMLWEGLKQTIMLPHKLMMKGVQKLRNLLPFSPAKEGPLKDLHRIKLVETIAATIKPAPMVDAMRNTVGQLSNLSGGSLKPQPVAATGGGMSLNYNPSITIHGGTGETGRNTMLEQLRAHKMEIERMMREIMQDQQRRKF